MSDRRAAAITHFVCGGITVVRAGMHLVNPEELPRYGEVWNPFLFQYGGPLTSLVVGSVLLVLGLLTLRAKDRAETTGALTFVYEADIPLAPVMAAFLLWLGLLSAGAILPYTGERGIEPGQLGAVALLVPMLFFGAWFLLHYRRLTTQRRPSRSATASPGRCCASATGSRTSTRCPFTWSPARASPSTGVLANGPKGSKLLTFTFSEGGANQCVANIRQATGWSSTEAPALKSA